MTALSVWAFFLLLGLQHFYNGSCGQLSQNSKYYIFMQWIIFSVAGLYIIGALLGFIDDDISQQQEIQQEYQNFDEMMEDIEEVGNMNSQQYEIQNFRESRSENNVNYYQNQQDEQKSNINITESMRSIRV